MKRFVFLISAVVLASCSDVNFGDLSSFGDSEASLSDTSRADYYTDDQLIISGKVQFREGNYGKSYSLFKQAINENPRDPAAWLGYAAASDMLRRFDQSKKAYSRLQPVIDVTGHKKVICLAFSQKPDGFVIAKVAGFCRVQ